MPPASAIERLASLVATPASEVEQVLAELDAGRGYERFEIPKRTGRAPRVIDAPCPPLKALQRKLIPLIEPLALGAAVHGFRRGRSIVTGALMHVDARALINVDLEGFFHSVTADRVRRTLRRSLEPRWVEETRELGRGEARAVTELIVRLCTAPVPGREAPALPQGAPTSPFLANLAARPLDTGIRALLDDTPGQYVYTRYADDLTISAPHEIDRRLLGAVLRVVARSGFRAHPGKIGLQSTLRGSPHYRQRLEVTGLVIDARERTVRIPRARMDRYRLQLHQAALAPRLDEAELRALEGIVAFVHMVYGRLPASLEAPYARLCERHGRPRLQPGKSRRAARAQARDAELYR
jgi:RNA-directed DNA polymerase